MNKTIKLFLSVFLIAVVVQTFHQIEHFSQIYQRLWLGVGPQHARGILFFLDVEWNHFLFNLSYFALLSVLAFIILYSVDLKSYLKQAQLGTVGLWCFTIGFLIQGYHVFEHTVRMGQFFQLGCTPCSGILGQFFDIAYLHFTFNTLTWLLPAVLILPLLQIYRAK